MLVGCRRVGGMVRFDVHDTGIGIRDDQMPRIFEAFTSLDIVSSQGLGVGLFIVRQAAAILGHRIEIASAPSRGTRFSVFADRDI